jgi:type IV secretory pathway TraG/TraD family ATPase VirD4
MVLGAGEVHAALVLGCGVLLGAYAWRRRDGATHRRGVVIRRQRRWHPLGLLRLRPALRFAAVGLSLTDESRHFKLIGNTGAGKSTAIRSLLAQALERGDRMVIADPDAGYVAHLHRKYRGDVILNPFEPGSVRWDLLAELRHPGDAEDLAGSLIAPAADPASGEWRSYARTFLSALLRRAMTDARWRCEDLWRWLSHAPVDELRALLAGTPAQPFLEPDNARMFGSIRAIAMAAMAPFEHVVRQRASPFSVRRWISDRRIGGCLFMPYQARQIAALRSLIAAWMRIAIYEALSGREGTDQRLWFVIDELDALGAIDGLKDALARLRKFGGRCVLGFQSIAQVSSTYGHGDAQTIVENCGNTLILRCSSSEQGGTSQFASRLIGEHEILRRQVTREQPSGLLQRSRAARSRQTSQQPLIEPAVLASQIEQLADLEGYFKRATVRHWLRVRLPREAGRPRPS